MKKFTIVSAVFLTLIITLFICLACIKPSVDFNYTPDKVYIYANSSTALKNGKGEQEFTPASITYRETLERVNNMFKLSMIEYASHGDSVNPTVGQDIENKYTTYSSNLLSKNYAIAYNFEEEQEQIVYYGGSSHIVNHYGFIIIIDTTKDYQEVPVYWKKSSGSSYEKSPMLLKAKVADLVEYIDSIK